jgi:hypothetical protein
VNGIGFGYRSVLAVLFALTLASCAQTIRNPFGNSASGQELTPEEQRIRELESNMSKTILQGAAVGAAAGAAIAWLSGEDTKNIAIAGAAGGAVGAAAGYYIASKQKSYANQEELLESMIEDVDKKNEQTESFIVNLREVVAEDKRRLSALEGEIAEGKATQADLEKERKRAEANRTVALSTLEKARGDYQEFEYASEVYGHDNPDVDVSDLDQQLEEFDSNLTALDELVSTMESA